MTDIVVTSNPWTPPGGIVRMTAPGQRLVAAPGLPKVEVVGGVYITSVAVGAVIDSTIKLRVPGNFAAAGAIQCEASQARINPYEIDLAGLPIQGVQLISGPAGKPFDVNLDGLYVYNNSLSPDDTNQVGFNHGVYFQDSVRATGKNMRFVDIRGGRSLHFYPNSTLSQILNVDSVNCYGDVVFWGAGVTGNSVAKLYSQNVGGRGVVEWGGGASLTTNSIDYKTIPTLGYGYIAPATPENITAARLSLANAQASIAKAIKLLG